jgi:hypothetical protein
VLGIGTYLNNNLADCDKSAGRPTLYNPRVPDGGFPAEWNPPQGRPVGTAQFVPIQAALSDRPPVNPAADARWRLS